VRSDSSEYPVSIAASSTRSIEAGVLRCVIHRSFRLVILRFAVMGCRREAGAALRRANGYVSPIEEAGPTCPDSQPAEHVRSSDPHAADATPITVSQVSTPDVNLSFMAGEFCTRFEEVALSVT